MLLSQPWGPLAQSSQRPSCVIFLHIFGWRNEAIQIISREVMVPRGLVVTGLDTLDQSGPDVANVTGPPPLPRHLPLAPAEMSLPPGN